MFLNLSLFRSMDPRLDASGEQFQFRKVPKRSVRNESVGTGGRKSSLKLTISATL